MVRSYVQLLVRCFFDDAIERLPPLRTPLEDIPILGCHFFRASCETNALSAPAPTPNTGLTRYARFPSGDREFESLLPRHLSIGCRACRAWRCLGYTKHDLAV
jgi:hypothetical protein